MSRGAEEKVGTACPHTSQLFLRNGFSFISFFLAYLYIVFFFLNVAWFSLQANARMEQGANIFYRRPTFLPSFLIRILWYLATKKKSASLLIPAFFLATRGHFLLPHSAYCSVPANSNSQLGSGARRQLRSLFDFMSLSDKCLSIIPLGVMSTLSVPPRWNLWFSKKETKRGVGGGSGSTKRGRVLITNIDHIFAERSLHKQMAAVCCSANVPCHNSGWFSSSISFILESRPLIWQWETFPPRLDTVSITSACAANNNASLLQSQ